MIEGPRFVPARQDFIIPSLRPPVTHDLEHPEYLDNEDFIIPLTPTRNYYPELPYHLRKYVLKKIRFEEGVVPESLWKARGDFIEKRVQDMVARLPGVNNVTRHEHDSKDDKAGHDLTVDYDGLRVYVQVKSSRYGIQEFKQAIRNKYFLNETNSMVLVREWMTKNRIILVNGSETRSDNEILDGSFYPQLERIIQRNLRRQIPEASGQMALLPKLGQMPEGFGQIVLSPEIQVFPKPLSPLARE